MRKIGIILFTMLFIVSTAGVLWFFLYARNEEDRIDPEYAVEVFDGEIETREFEFDKFNKLYFLYDNDPLTEFTKKTRMLNATPNLKIVNSEDYRVEITTNADVFDKLKIGLDDSPEDPNKVGLVVTFADECYVPVHVDDNSYDYDTGLYVDFDAFEVTVYAPIHTLCVDSEMVLDYEAPKCEEMYVYFSFEGTEANIYGIDTEHLAFYCSGTSDVKLSGEVRGMTKIMIFHDTKVDANKLDTEFTDFYVSSAMFDQFSYIKYNHLYYIGIINGSLLATTFIMIILLSPSIISLACLIFCIRKGRA